MCHIAATNYKPMCRVNFTEHALSLVDALALLVSFSLDMCAAGESSGSDELVGSLHKLADGSSGSLRALLTSVGDRCVTHKRSVAIKILRLF